MTTIWNNEKLKVFVKNTLGCGCPEKVFEKIEVSKHLTEEHEKEITRIVVGDTLLIYVIPPEPSGEFVDRKNGVRSFHATLISRDPYLCGTERPDPDLFSFAKKVPPWLPHYRLW